MLAPVRVADFVVDGIAARIGAVPPEQGGALLGLPGLDYVTEFIHDAEAPTSGVRYQNTDWLIREIGAREERSAARFKGVVHSHPAGMPRPSGQDRSEYAESLRLNPQLARYLAPIVTHDVDAPLRAHELRLGPARMSFFGAARVAGRIEVGPVRPVVVPVVRILRRAGISLDADPAAVEVEGAALLATHARIPGFGAVTVLLGADFPATAPVVLPEDGDGPLGLVWDLAVPALERMAKAVLELRRTGTRAREGRDASHQVGRGSPGLAAVGEETSHGDRAEGGTDAGVVASADERAESDTAIANDEAAAASGGATSPSRVLFARTEGILSPALEHRRVLIAGAGSVGSYLAETLARSGVGAFTLIDPDGVEPANLGRSAYRLADLGLPKARALADLVLSVNPAARVDLHVARVDDLDPAGLAATVAESDLVIAATDDPEAQARLGHFAYRHGRPAVFPGLYQGAQGGEIIVVADGTPCWACATGGVRADLAETGQIRATDYGTGRLVAEPGLLADIHHVASAAAKIALGLLHDPDDPAAAARFAQGILKSGATYVVFADEPGYWIFADLMRQAPAQYAYQSLWLSVESRPDCPVCGDPDGRTDPAAYQEPDIAAVRDALRRQA